MLVSQGKEPDHTITVWDWSHAQIILRVKSHGQDVFNAEFSQFVPGQLTTSGTVVNNDKQHLFSNNTHYYLFNKTWCFPTPSKTSNISILLVFYLV